MPPNALIPFGEFVPGLIFEYFLKKGSGEREPFQNPSDTQVNVYWEGTVGQYTVGADYTIYISPISQGVDHYNIFNDLLDDIKKIYIETNPQHQALFDITEAVMEVDRTMTFTATFKGGNFAGSGDEPCVVDFIIGVGSI